MGTVGYPKWRREPRGDPINGSWKAMAFAKAIRERAILVSPWSSIVNSSKAPEEAREAREIRCGNTARDPRKTHLTWLSPPC